MQLGDGQKERDEKAKEEAKSEESVADKLRRL